MDRIKFFLVPLCILLMQGEATASEACDIYVEFLNREGRVRDGDQFAGWKNKGGHRQWQSCTRENPPPDCEYYNASGCTVQVANPYNQRDYAFYTERHWNESCDGQFRGGVYVVRRAYMSILELDWPDEDDHITTIRYGDIRVPIRCSGIWRCEGQSSWKSPESGDSAVTARVSVRVWTRHHER